MAVAVSCAPAARHSLAGADSVLRDRLPQLWRSIENAHYTYLEVDDSPEKLQHRKKLEGYIMEYLSLVPHECKFGLSETGRVFARTVSELHEFSAYKAGVGWAAIARYAANLLAQPWRKEYRTIRLYCGYYKHEVESSLVTAETMLHVMGYRSDGAARMSLDGPVCPDLVAAVSRDALIAYVECQMMCEVWERAWRVRGGVSWSQVARERARRAGDVAATVARLTRGECSQGAEIYSNVKPSAHTEAYRHNIVDAPEHWGQSACPRQPPLSSLEPPAVEEHCYPLVQPSYVTVAPAPHNILYRVGPQELQRYADIATPCNPMVGSFGVVPGFYFPVQTPYVIPAPMYSAVEPEFHAVNGYHAMHRFPAVPTAQLIDLEHSAAYDSSDAIDGKQDRYRDGRTYRDDCKYREEGKTHREDKYRDDKESRKSHDRPQEHRKSTQRPITDVLRSDMQPALSAAREDGLGTYESWDYVFRNLSQRDERNERHRRNSPPLDRDSRTLERLERDDRRRFQPSTMDLEDGLLALNLDRSYDEEIYRTAKVNESLARLKQESELKKAKAAVKRQIAEERERRSRSGAEQPLVEIETNPKVAPDKVRLISKKETEERKEIIKQCTNGRPDVKTTKGNKPSTKAPSSEAERSVRMKPSPENGMQAGSRSPSSASHHGKEHNGARDLGTRLVVSLDEPDAGDATRWQCATCTYVNAARVRVCDMCGKSRVAGPEAAPLTSGGRECPACTLVNTRQARVCDACGTSLQDSPTYI